ncbi:MAG: hypothetical protein LBQ52_08100, partial [Helicobacteraceae bacterium]|nr:hypothetical protein [Helicobacteraceae bacterium]
RYKNAKPLDQKTLKALALSSDTELSRYAKDAENQKKLKLIETLYRSPDSKVLLIAFYYDYDERDNTDGAAFILSLDRNEKPKQIFYVFFNEYGGATSSAIKEDWILISAQSGGGYDGAFEFRNSFQENWRYFFDKNENFAIDETGRTSRHHRYMGAGVFEALSVEMAQVFESKLNVNSGDAKETQKQEKKFADPIDNVIFDLSYFDKRFNDKDVSKSVSAKINKELIYILELDGYEIKQIGAIENKADRKASLPIVGVKMDDAKILYLTELDEKGSIVQAIALFCESEDKKSCDVKSKIENNTIERIRRYADNEGRITSEISRFIWSYSRDKKISMIAFDYVYPKEIV